MDNFKSKVPTALIRQRAMISKIRKISVDLKSDFDQRLELNLLVTSGIVSDSERLSYGRFSNRYALLALISLLAIFCLSRLVHAQGQFGNVIRVDRAAFSANAGLITFSEVKLKTENPIYPAEKYGGVSTGPVVSFGGFFEGQRLGRKNECPSGAVVTGCVVQRPTAPLRISNSAPNTFVARDSSNPDSPSLSGTPRFNGVISIYFDRDLAGVGLIGGFFDSVNSTAITVYNRDGRQIGGVKNVDRGMEYLALVTDDGSNTIAGLQFSLVGPEAAGFGIDEVSFAYASQMNPEAMNAIGLGDVLSKIAREVQKPIALDEPAKPGLGQLFHSLELDTATQPESGLGDLFKE